MSDNIKDSKEAPNYYYTYHYKFTLTDNTEKDFNIKLDRKTMNLIQAERESYPKWTELGFHKCPNCSLGDARHKYCPAATSLIDLIEFFSKHISYEEADVMVEVEERKYEKHTTLQRGLSSLIGIYMVTSGCPVMEKLKPMVRYHLPFATQEETKYRVLSMYLLAQYFMRKHNQGADWKMKRLVGIYNNIRIVNDYFCKRLSGVEIEDAGVNAVVILDCFASAVIFSMGQEEIEKIEPLFSAYFR